MIQHPIDIIPPKPATTPPATKQAPSIEELVRRARQSVPQGEFHS